MNNRFKERWSMKVFSHCQPPFKIFSLAIFILKILAIHLSRFLENRPEGMAEALTREQLLELTKDTNNFVGSSDSVIRDFLA